MTEYIYHLTATELRDLMLLAIAKWEALDRDVTAAVDAALAEDDAKRLENSLPLVDEDDLEWTEPKREYCKIPVGYGYATCEFCPEPTDAEFIIFADGVSESEVCNKHLPDDIPENSRLLVDLADEDGIPFDGYTPAIEDEDTISAEALLNNEIACPYCDGEYIITRSGNEIAATCSQCGYKELAGKPDNISPAAIDDNPAIPDSWYTVSTVGYTAKPDEFIATVDRETNQVDYEDAK